MMEYGTGRACHRCQLRLERVDLRHKSRFIIPHHQSSRSSPLNTFFRLVVAFGKVG